MLWVRMCRRVDPALALWLACPARRCMPRGWWEVARGWGAPLAVVRGILGLGALPVSAAFPWGTQPGSIACLSWERGVGMRTSLLQAGVVRFGGGRGESLGAGVETRHLPFGLHALLGVACRGGGGRLPGWGGGGGAPLAVVMGAP